MGAGAIVSRFEATPLPTWPRRMCASKHSPHPHHFFLLGTESAFPARLPFVEAFDNSTKLPGA